jgi:hypothetical protein
MDKWELRKAVGIYCRCVEPATKAKWADECLRLSKKVSKQWRKDIRDYEKQKDKENE